MMNKPDWSELREMSIEEGFEAIERCGYAPALINDDEGHWAVSSSGCSEMCEKVESVTSYIDGFEYWKDSIKEAWQYFCDQRG